MNTAQSTGGFSELDGFKVTVPKIYNSQMC